MKTKRHLAQLQHHTFFAARVAGAENLEILRAGGEFLGYLSLVERAQQAEIPYRQPEIPVGEIPEILLEFIRFGVLMIDPVPPMLASFALDSLERAIFSAPMRYAQ